LIDIGSHIGYLQGLFCRYPELDKGKKTHNRYGGLPLRGDLTDCTINTMWALIDDSYTSNLLKGVSSPSWMRRTYSSEGGSFSATISCLCAFSLYLFILVGSLIVSWP
jgi:hypothetical protein